jgi:hypothetical protein
MIASQSGSQKSGFALYIAAMLNLPTWYLSADMAQHTASTRLVAALSGDATETVSAGLTAGAEDYYADYLDGNRVRFCFNPNPDSHDIAEEMDAWVEAWDSYPRLIVLDNLLDIIPSSGADEYSGYKSVLLDAKTLARTTGACVLILHHMSESTSDPFLPAAKKSLMGKVSQSPENVLSIAIGEDPSEFRVSVVKQRSGPSDASGRKYERLRVFPERNCFERWSEPDPMKVAAAKFWKAGNVT